MHGSYFDPDNELELFLSVLHTNTPVCGRKYMDRHGLLSLLSDEEINVLDHAVENGRGRHPAWTAMHACDLTRDYTPSPKDYLVNNSIDAIGCQDGGTDWLASIKSRIVQTADFAEAASALAEIRCYGAMLEAGFELRPVATSKVKGVATPDFEFVLDGEDGAVEVTTKLEHDAQVERAKAIAEGQDLQGVERSVFETKAGKATFTAYESHPFGAPHPGKAGDTTQTNAISRICSIKAKETQYADGKPSLLWIDFRDLGTWPNILSPDNAFPLMSGRNGTLTSGAIWYGFYGWKGAPVFEEDRPGIQSYSTMGHYGRFNPGTPKPSRYSAAIICLVEKTLLFENPLATVPLSPMLRTQLTRLPRFDISYAVAEWQTGDLQKKLEVENSLITALR